MFWAVALRSCLSTGIVLRSIISMSSGVRNTFSVAAVGGSSCMLQAELVKRLMSDGNVSEYLQCFQRNLQLTRSIYGMADQVKVTKA